MDVLSYAKAKKNEGRLDTVESELAQTTQQVNQQKYFVSIDEYPRLATEVQDSPRIQRAIDGTEKGIIIFKPELYTTNTRLQGKIGVSLMGVGANSGAQSPSNPATVFQSETLTSGDLLSLGVLGDTGEGNLIIERIRFQAINTSKDAIIGITSYWKNVTIRDCGFTDFTTGVKINAVQCWVERNYASSCGISFDISFTENHVLFNHSFSSGIDILLREAGNICIGNKMFGDGSGGITGIEIRSFGNVVIGNYIDAYSDKGIFVSPQNGNNADGNIITGNRIYGIGVEGQPIRAGIYVDAQYGNADGNTITGNTIGNKRSDRTSQNGIRINAVSPYTAKNNTITANSIAEVTGQPITQTGGGDKTGNKVVANGGYVTENGGSFTGVHGDLIPHGLSGQPKKVIVSSSDSITFCGADLFTTDTFRLQARDNAGNLITTAKTFYFDAEM